MVVTLVIEANVATLVWTPHPIIIWNMSPSAPIGAYLLESKQGIVRGDMVAARVPLPWRGIASGRHYIPANVPLIKRVAAAGGDRICSLGRSLAINGRVAAIRREQDGQGRRLPAWEGCRTLGRDQYLLLTDDAASFDGRYFGPTSQADLIGEVRQLWTR
ncbi:MAG: S26 family signal peptidase [Sphingopyxis sp.]|uniref:S26 family signal peptidase n=1 Tax=Sphingopyxis sp. TaxID=1908224 RepID=UPI001A61964C|nr:S26 family signal peptidase [Sphingopyxis sp.]MBL9071856.1 S26 family signal peptidase [Sphingopyxis sp.]